MHLDNNYNKGFGLTGVITFLALIIVIGGIGYYTWNNSKLQIDKDLLDITDNNIDQENLLAESDTDGFIGAPQIDLKPVDGSNASGQAFMYVEDNVTYHKLILKDLPPLSTGFFYEGWLVKDAKTGEFVSTGKINFEPEKNSGSLFYQINGDQTDFNTVVVTLEPDDGDPAPAGHTLEGKFPKDLDFIKKKSEKVSGSFEDYQKNKIALSDDGKVVLFFHAPWCPTCRSLESDIVTNSDMIPENLTILKTDYDSNSDLKAKYGVNTQHTLVQVDNQGKLLKKWLGSANLKALIGEVI